MSRFVEHSDDWPWMPPIPPKHWKGWWISNDDGEPNVGPFPTKEEADAELVEIDRQDGTRKA